MLYTKHDFFSALSGENTITIKDYHINDTIEIDQHNFKGNELRLVNCEFNELKINNLQIQSGLRLINCQITRLLIVNISASGQRHINQVESGSIYLENTTITEQLRIQNCELFSEIVILNDCKIDICAIILNRYPNIGGIAIQKSSFTDLFISGLKSKEGVTIRDSKIEGKFTSSHNLVNGCQLVNSNINELNISNNIIRSYIRFVGGIYNGNCRIFDIVSTQDGTTLFFQDVQFKKTVWVRLNKSTEASITLSNITIESTIFNEIVFENRIVILLKRLTIKASKSLAGDIIFKNIQVDVAEISGSNYNSTITFERAAFKSLNFENFSNYANIKLINSLSIQIPQSSLSIINSYMGTFQFSNVNFNNFEEIIIFNSDITQISTASVTWFEIKKLEINPQNYRIKAEVIDIKVYSLKCKHEICRQLKIVTEKNGDRVNSLIFKSYEMEFYRKELRLTKKWYTQERILLFANLSNDHGLNWIKPVLLAIGITIFLYIILIIQNSRIFKLHFSAELADIVSTLNLFWEEKRLILILLNPVNSLKNDILHESVFNNLPDWIHLIYFIQKIILSFLIFQTISAFRRYSKA